MPYKKRVLDSFYMVGQPLLVNALGVPATAYIIRKLGPSGYGEWALAASLIAALAPLTSVGLRPLFLRSVAQEPEHANQNLQHQIGLRLCLSFVVAALALLFAWSMGYPATVIRCVALASAGAVLGSMWTVLGDFLQGSGDHGAYAAGSLVGGLVVTAASVIAVALGAKAVALSAVYLVGPLATLIYLCRQVQHRNAPIRPRFDFSHFAELLREARTVGYSQGLAALRDRADQLLLPKLVGITQFGYFSAGTVLPMRLVVLPDGLSSAFYPAIAASAEDQAATEIEVTRLLRASVLVCIPAAVLIGGLAAPIEEILFPGALGVCRMVIESTIWSIPLLGLSIPMASALQAVGRHSEAAHLSSYATVLGTVSSIVLVLLFGLTGVCWSFVIRPALVAAFLLPLFMRVFPSVFNSLRLGRIGAAAGVMALLLWLTTSVHWPLLLGALVRSGTALLGYTAVLLVLRVIDPAFLAGILARPNAARS
jgi:O-antigen/teichoic acid export membrane protein